MQIGAETVRCHLCHADYHSGPDSKDRGTQPAGVWTRSGELLGICLACEPFAKKLNDIGDEH